MICEKDGNANNPTVPLPCRRHCEVHYSIDLGIKKSEMELTKYATVFDGQSYCPKYVLFINALSYFYALLYSGGTFHSGTTTTIRRVLLY